MIEGVFFDGKCPAQTVQADVQLQFIPVAFNCFLHFPQSSSPGADPGSTVVVIEDSDQIAATITSGSYCHIVRVVSYKLSLEFREDQVSVIGRFEQKKEILTEIRTPYWR